MMRSLHKSILSFIIFSVSYSSFTKAETEFSGQINLDFQYFTIEALLPDQHDSYLSVGIEPEIHHSWNDDQSSFLFKPFLRADQHDDNRTHGDIRELYWQTVTDDYELRVGISKVFWGATESQHLVDIINQADLVESFDGEEKLGQPMIKLSFEKDWGNLDLFILPYFRERTFTGEEGRLRPALLIDNDYSQYESSDEENNIDVAIRFFTTIEDWDLGLSYFDGTSRDPVLTPILNAQSQLILAPVYEQIQQIGLDLTGTVEDWIWKLETIHRNSEREAYNALTGGYEYTFYGVMESAIDIGLVNEYLFDSRDEDATTPFQNDLMLGLRFNFNDEQSTEALVGFIYDLDMQSQLISLEANQRIGDNIKIELEVRIFTNIDIDDLAYSYRDDDHIKINLSYYY